MFRQTTYPRRSGDTSALLDRLFELYRRDGIIMTYAMEEFRRAYVKEHFPDLTPEERKQLVLSLPPEERQDCLATLPLEERFAGLSPEQIRQYLDQLTAGQPSPPRKPRRKKE